MARDARKLLHLLSVLLNDTEFEKRNEQLEPTLQGPNPYSASTIESAEAREWRRGFPTFRQNYESAPFSLCRLESCWGLLVFAIRS